MQNTIPTAHISCTNPELIAKTVLMPGDPLRAKFIADTYLTDVVEFNSVRGMLGYTGTYNGKKVSVMGSGMGMPSIGIYSYELYAFYGVERIIRIGTAGSYDTNYALYDVILAEDAFTESSYAKTMLGLEDTVIKASKSFNDDIKAAAEKLGKKLSAGRIHSSDVFYRQNGDINKMREEFGCSCVEMESFALFTNAMHLGKEAACLVTISDHLVTGEVTTSDERQMKLHDMIEIALNTI